MTPGRFALRRAADTVAAGGIVAYPTEAVYGIGCDPYDAAAVHRLARLKNRPLAQGLIVIAAQFAALEPLLGRLSGQDIDKMHATWPGPCTWIVPAQAPPWLTGGRSTLAIRVTAHPVARALCEATDGVLVSTSANRSGHPPARSALGVRRAFGDRIDYILAGATGDRGRPTEIRDLATGTVLREG